MNINLKENQDALIIGDIHGCYDELVELINKSGVRVGKDIIISVGDMVDRGYKSYEVIKFFKQTPNTFSIMGNHEMKHLKKKMIQGSLFDKQDFSGELQRLMLPDEDYKEMVEFFSTLPLYIELTLANKIKYLIVHAGWHRYIVKDDIHFDSKNYKLMSEDVKYVLGVGSKGREGFDNKSFPWFNTLPNIYKVVYGHTKYETVERGLNNNVFGIDTGCYEGRHLSALLLPSEKIVQVEAKRDYYKQILTERLDDLYLNNYEKLNWKDKEALLKKSESAELLKKIEVDFKSIHFLYTYIISRADEYKKSFKCLDNDKKKEIRQNWNKKKQFPKEFSQEIQKAFFHDYNIKNLYAYSPEQINYFISIINPNDAEEL
ncbi:metallophosphoesterase [bacterium]|nr:metallophosphoesterase [bacterium]